MALTPITAYQTNMLPAHGERTMTRMASASDAAEPTTPIADTLQLSTEATVAAATATPLGSTAASAGAPPARITFDGATYQLVRPQPAVPAGTGAPGATASTAAPSATDLASLVNALTSMEQNSSTSDLASLVSPDDGTTDLSGTPDLSSLLSSSGDTTSLDSLDSLFAPSDGTSTTSDGTNATSGSSGTTDPLALVDPLAASASTGSTTDLMSALLGGLSTGGSGTDPLALTDVSGTDPLALTDVSGL